jgi:hypothetical protein
METQTVFLLKLKTESNGICKWITPAICATANEAMRFWREYVKDSAYEIETEWEYSYACLTGSWTAQGNTGGIPTSYYILEMPLHGASLESKQQSNRIAALEAQVSALTADRVRLVAILTALAEWTTLDSSEGFLRPFRKLGRDAAALLAKLEGEK